MPVTCTCFMFEIPEKESMKTTIDRNFLKTQVDFPEYKVIFLVKETRQTHFQRNTEVVGPSRKSR